MATVTRIEKRQRGFFGWVFLILFWGFNALMLYALLAGLGATADSTAAMKSEAEHAGAAIGTVLGMGMILSIWMAGAVILGMFVIFTRGKKIVIETTRDR
jgi:hypothetical protein